MISVIVVTYNQEQTISRTLDSILCQQCHLPVEIVIGEDCSTDRTREICRQYARRHPQRIRLIENEHNKGLIDNYYDCLLACQGKFIADCAGDDFWVDDLKLEKEARLLEADDSITLVHTAWRYYDETTQRATDAPTQPFPAPLTDGRQMLEAILTQTRMPVIHLCTSLYRADTMRRAYQANVDLLRNPESGCEDLPIAFLLAHAGRIAYLPDVTLHYSQGNTSVSSPGDIRDTFAFYKRATHLSYCLSEKYRIRNRNTRRFFSNRSLALLMHAFRAHDIRLRNEALGCQRQWGARTDYRIGLVRLLTQWDFLWRLALYIREKIR